MIIAILIMIIDIDIDNQKLFTNANIQTWTINGITTRTSFQLSQRDKRQPQQQQPKVNRSILNNNNSSNGKFIFDVRIFFCLSPFSFLLIIIILFIHSSFYVDKF